MTSKPQSFDWGFFVSGRLINVFDPSEFIGKTELLSAFTVLATVISALWLVNQRDRKKDQERLSKAEEANIAATSQILDLHGKHEFLSGKMDGHMKGVQNLHDEVLSEIRKFN